MIHYNVKTFKGDSGGPLLCRDDDDNSRYVQHGVYSVGTNTACDGKADLDIFTRVAFYRDFIYDIINHYD